MIEARFTPGGGTVVREVPPPTVLIGYVDDMDEILIAHADEEVLASAMDFYFKNWPESSWPNYILMEVST